jgi:hypothetical protein
MQLIPQWVRVLSYEALLRRAQTYTPYILMSVLGACYLVAALLLPTGLFFSQDSDAKFLQTRALAQSLWRSDGFPDPARTIDPSGVLSPLRPSFAGHFFYERDGQWHSKYSIPFALLASIPYKLFGVRGLGLVSVLPAIGSLLLTLYAARLLRIRRPWLAILLLGACTPLPFYGVEFWEHALGLMLALIAILCTLRDEPLRPGNLLLAGMAVGVGVWFRIELICLAPAMGLALFGQLRREHVRAGLLFGLGLVMGLLPYVAINWLYAGSLMGNQLGAELQLETRSHGLLVAFQAQLEMAWLMLGPSRFRKGWLVLLPLLLLATLVVWRRRGRAAACSTAVLLLLVSTGAALLWGLRTTGIHNYPIDLLSAGGVIVLALLYPLYKPEDAQVRSRVIRLTILGSVFGLLVLATSPHFGGQQWGPRYLLPLYPILVLIGTLGLEGLLAAASSRERTRLLAASMLLALLSFGISIQSIGYVVAWRELHQSTVSKIASLRPEVLITDVHVLPFTIATVLDRQVLLGVEHAEQVRQAAELLSRRGHDELLWVSTSTPFPHNWQKTPVPPNLNRELQHLGWTLTETTTDRGGYIYTHYQRASP